MPTHQHPTPQEVKAISAEAKTLQARIVTGRGDVVFAFYPEAAPTTVSAFVKLSRDGFYNGLTFHRVEPGFVVQGGCPRGNGTGGPGYNLKAEFNDRPHVEGAVAMARAQNPDSAGSQFYICLGDARFLDRKYTVFGKVTEGMQTVKQLKVGDKIERIAIELAQGR